MSHERYAYCLGANGPQSSAYNALKYAEKDAEQLAYALATSPCHFVTKWEVATSRNSTLAGLSQFVKWCQSPDLLIIHFSGHAILDEDLYLLCNETDCDDLISSAIEIGAVKKILSRSLARYTILVLDCCHAGGAYQGTFRGEQDIQNVLNQAFQGSANVILAACARYERTRELDTLNGGAGFLSWALTAACTNRFHEVSRDGRSLALGDILRWLPLALEEVNHSLNENQRLPLPEALIYTRGGDGNIWFARPGRSISHRIERNERQDKELRLKARFVDHSGFMRDRLESFVGRQKELVQIQQRIEEKQQTGGYITITGQAGQGKSSIIAKLVEKYGTENVAFHFIPLNPGPDHQVGLLRNLMARLILKHNLSDLYIATESRAALRDYFSKVLIEIAEKGEQEVIFIDGLDQLEEDLSSSRDLSFLPINPPLGIIFVLGTRPNDTLKPLTLLKPHSEYRLPNLSRHDFDLILHHRHVDLERDLADEFYRVMQENALYLDLVARELAEGEVTSPVETIRRIANNPNSIFSLAMARFKQHHTQWREVIKPVLGVLLAAREPLSVRHIRQVLGLEDDWLREGIERLGGLVTKDGQQRYALFHLKLQDYLRQDEDNPDKEYIFASDEEEKWHKKLALWCEQGNLPTIWHNVKGNPTEQGRREYARRYYAAHLYHAKDWQQLFAVLDAEAYGKAKIRDDPSTRSFAQDLNLGRYAAAREEETMEKALEMLPQLWRYTLLGCSLTSRADRYPIESFEALVLLKRELEAIGLAELLTNLDYKVEVLLHIAKQFREQGREQEYLQMLLRSYEIFSAAGGNKLNIGTLRELAIELTKGHLWEQLDSLLHCIEDRWIISEILSILSMELIKEQQWRQAESTARNIQESGIRTNVLNTLSMELIKAQQWEQAERVMHAIESSGLYAKLVSELNIELIRAQQWERAEQLAYTIKNREILDRMLRQLAIAFAQAQQWEQAERITRSIKNREILDDVKAEFSIELAKAHNWKRAEEVTHTIKDRKTLDNVKAELSIELIRAQQWIQAEQIALSIKDRKALDNAKATLGIELAKAHNWKRAEQIALSIETYSERIRALAELSIELIKARQWERAERVVYNIEESGERIKILCELSIALVDAQNPAQAEEVWIKIRGEVQNIEEWKRIGILNELIIELVKCQQFERAEQIAYTFKANEEEQEAHVALLYGLVETLASARQWKRAKEIWEEVEKMVREMDLWYEVDAGVHNRTLYELAIALTQAHQWEDAETLWEDAETLWEDAEQLLWDTQDSEVLIETTCELVTAFAKIHQWERAEELLKRAEEDFKTSWYYEDIPTVLIELGEALESLQWGQSEVETRFIVNLEKRAKMLIKSGNALIEEEQWRLTEELADTIVDNAERTEILIELGLKLVRAQQWEWAKKVTDSIEDSAMRTEVLGEFSLELAKAQLWERAKAIADSIEESGERARVLYILVGLLAKAQEWKQAEKIWYEATQIRWTTDEESIRALNELGIVLAIAQQKKGAEKVWTQAEEAIDSQRDSEGKLQTLVQLTIALVKGQRWEWAEKVWFQVRKAIDNIWSNKRWMDEISVELEDEVADRNIGNIMHLDQALKGLSLALMQAQKWEKVEEVICLIRQPETRIDVLGEFSVELARTKSWHPYEKIWKYLIKNMEDNRENTEALRKLGIALAQIQQWERAKALAFIIEEPLAKADVLIQLGTCLAQQNQWEWVKESWNLAETVIFAIEDDWVKTEALRKLGIALAQTQQWKQAEALVSIIEEPFAKADVLIQLGTCFAQRDQWGRANESWNMAEKVASTIWERKTRSDVLQKLSIAASHISQYSQSERLWLQAEMNAEMIQETWAKNRALGEISKSLALVGQWRRSEKIAREVEGDVYRSQIMIELGAQLAKANKRERAKAVLADGEEIIRSIENIETKVILLKKIADIFNMLGSYEQILYLVQRSWLQASTREEAIKLVSLADALIPIKPKIGIDFGEAFQWVDTILEG